jgi:hypothetical protein
MYITREEEKEEDWRNWMKVFARTGKATSRIVAVGILRGRIT